MCSAEDEPWNANGERTNIHAVTVNGNVYRKREIGTFMQDSGLVVECLQQRVFISMHKIRLFPQITPWRLQSD